MLEQAVADRTRELSEANEALRAEAEERQAAEAQLRQVQKMEAVGQLTGGIAHDFNNMLAVVVGGIDLARRRLNGPRREVLNHLTNAMEGATRAAALTRRLLSFARSEPLLPERVDAAELVGGMSDLLDRTLGERIRIEVDLARRHLADLRRPAPAGKCDRQPRGQCPRRDGRHRRAAHRDRQRHACRQPGRRRAGRRICARFGDRHRHRHDPRSARARVRALLHHQAGRQGHRPRPEPDFRLRPPVGRRGRDRKRGRPRHDRVALPAANDRQGARPAAFRHPGDRPGRHRRRRPDPGGRGRSQGARIDRRGAPGPRLRAGRPAAAAKKRSAYSTRRPSTW